MYKYLLMLKRLDWVLLATTLGLLLLGLLAIYAINLGWDSVDYITFKKQLGFVGLGLVFLIFFSLFDYRILRNYSNLIYVVSVIVLIAVLFLGTELRGTKGWFQVGTFYLQPVELVKLSTVIFLAKFFASWGRQLFRVKYLILSILLVGLVLGLVLMQPDFGSGMILLGIWFGLVLIIGMNKRHLMVLIGLLIISTGLMWSFGLKNYQRSRILAVLDTDYDPQGRGYNLAQSKIATGSGQLFGRGLGFGSQTQLKFLPESKTDFIFAVIAEELGFIGVTLVLILYFVFLMRVLMIAMQARDDFARVLCLGIFIILTLHIVINIGMNMGLAPVLGISLPLLSYGGSFMVSVMIMIGIVQGIYIRSKLEQE